MSILSILPVFGSDKSAVDKSAVDKKFSDELLTNFNIDYLKALYKKSWLPWESQNYIDNLIRFLEYFPDYQPNIEKDMFTIQDWLLSVDGYGLPTEFKTDTYDNMINNPKEFLYPWPAISFFNMVAKIMDTQFDWWDLTAENLTSGELSEQYILDQLNAWDNLNVLESVYRILGTGDIPLAKTNTGGIISAFCIVKDDYGFRCNNGNTEPKITDIIAPKRYSTI